nr:reverse transcriptase domain-containing protein [Tanacetum cinerariifolium]
MQSKAMPRNKAIPFGRPYHTHPNGSRKLLTARKRVGPFLACKLTWRRISHRLLDHHSSPNSTSDSSSSSSSLDSSSDASLSSSSDSLSDSSSVHSSRCDASDSPALADLLPHKRFRDSYSFEASEKEHMEIGTADAKTVMDIGISEGVRAPTEDGICMRVEVSTINIKEDEAKFEVKASVRGTMEIAVDLLVTGGIYESTGGDAPNRQLEAGQLVASEERAGLADRVRRLRRKNLRVRALLCIEKDRANSLCHHMALSHKEFRQIDRDRDGTRRRVRRLEYLVKRRLGFYRNSNSDTNKIMAGMDAMTIKMDAQYKELQSRAKQPTLDLDDDDIHMSHEEDAKFMQTFRKTRFYNDYKIFHSIKGTILEEEIFSEYDKFITMTVKENYDSESDIEEPPFEKITINTYYKIKTSLKEPHTDLELKPLPNNLEYVFLEEPSFLPVIISSKLSA